MFVFILSFYNQTRQDRGTEKKKKKKEKWGEKVNRGKGDKIEKKRDRERKNTENLLHHLLKKTSKNTVWKPQQQPTYALLTVNKKY